MTVRENTSGLDDLADAFDDAAKRIGPEAKRALARGALNVKKGAQRRASGLAHAPAYPRSIGYDLHWSGTGGVAEIGPDKDRRQGALGNILEYGTVNNPPIPHLGPALDDEAPQLHRHLSQLGEDLLR